MPSSAVYDSDPTTLLLSGDEVVAALDRLESTLVEFSRHDESVAAREAFVRARRAAAQSIVQLSKRAIRKPLVDRATALIGRFAGAGMQVWETEVDDAGWLHGLEGGEWPTVLAMMMLTSAWQVPRAPRLGAVPDWMWGEYAAWLFSPPRQVLRPGDADAYFEQAARQLEELNHWQRRNPGSAAVRAAADAYVRVTSQLPLTHARKSVRRYAELRGEFLSRFYASGTNLPPVSLFPRIGRRLRIGFVQARVGPGADLRTVAPLYSHLDPRSFETILLSLSQDDVEFAKQRVASTEAVVVLAPNPGDRIAELRSMALDAVVFCDNVAAQLTEITQLASQRVAPLQVVNYRSSLTTGLPEIDLFVTAEQTYAPELTCEYTERLGVVCGPAMPIALPVGGGEAVADGLRARVGMPADAVLFFSVVTAEGISLETGEIWARLLAQSPGARLVLVRETNEKATEVVAATTHFCQALGRVLTSQSVASERVAVFPLPVGACHDVRMLLGMADVCLEAGSSDEPTWVAEALALGLPVVALAAGKARRWPGASGLLASLALDELIAPNAAAWLAQAAGLAADRGRRMELGARIRAAIDVNPGFRDELAASDAFGALLETAFDELAALGPEQFRAQREPLRCMASEVVMEMVAAGEAALACGDNEGAAFEAGLALRADALNVGARILRGRALLAEGDTARAVTYLLAAVEYRSDDPGLWYTLAVALRQNRQGSEALQALETSLRLDRGQVEAWLMLLEIAEGAGAVEIARDAVAVLREIAPDDPRVALLP